MVTVAGEVRTVREDRKVRTAPSSPVNLPSNKEDQEISNWKCSFTLPLLSFLVSFKLSTF